MPGCPKHRLQGAIETLIETLVTSTYVVLIPTGLGLGRPLSFWSRVRVTAVRSGRRTISHLDVSQTTANVITDDLGPSSELSECYRDVLVDPVGPGVAAPRDSGDNDQKRCAPSRHVLSLRFGKGWSGRSVLVCGLAQRGERALSAAASGDS